MLGLALVFLLGSFFPRIEDPWPETIGLGLPFTVAGAGGVLAGVLFANSLPARRDKWILRLGLWGFRLGAAFYLLSLAVQVVFR